MTAWLLDTNVLSELRRPRPEVKVVQFIVSRPIDVHYERASVPVLDPWII